MRIAWCLVLILTSAAQERKIGQGVNFYSREKEAALGGQLAKELRQQTTVIDSVMLRDYIEDIGRKLAAQLPEPRYTYTFSMVADDVGGTTHEPLSLPAGYIFVPAKLILAAQNEAEFAGMLAHAMSHVAARHHTRQATRDEVGPPRAAGWGAGGLSRGFELEADTVAITIMSRAGYDPEALVRYIGRVQPDAPAPGERAVFSGLPPRDSRIQSMGKVIRELPPGAYTFTSEFQRVQDELRSLPPTPAVAPPSLAHPNRKP